MVWGWYDRGGSPARSLEMSRLAWRIVSSKRGGSGEGSGWSCAGACGAARCGSEQDTKRAPKQVQAAGTHPAELRRLARQLRDRHRPHQLLRRRLARHQTPERLEDHAPELDVSLETELKRLAEARLDLDRVVADADAEQPFVSDLRRRGVNRELLAVSQHDDRDRLLRALRDRLLQPVRQGDRLTLVG